MDGLLYIKSGQFWTKLTGTCIFVSSGGLKTYSVSGYPNEEQKTVWQVANDFISKPCLVREFFTIVFRSIIP